MPQMPVCINAFSEIDQARISRRSTCLRCYWMGMRFSSRSKVVGHSRSFIKRQFDPTQFATARPSLQPGEYLPMTARPPPKAEANFPDHLQQSLGPDKYAEAYARAPEFNEALARNGDPAIRAIYPHQAR